ncbi:MAG: lipopolysaccharide biosynthesis protein RfbH [Candidatus Omnitrophica bacterium]|nr:lipopolysaccharide biosynthesis protein RfbH [Candidatus Omnitrophota bacterium]
MPTAISEPQVLKAEILELVRRYYQQAHPAKPFIPGKTRIQYSGRVYDAQELVNAVDASLDFWLTAGSYTEAFERKMQAFFGANGFLLVNSGSAANLLMVATLCSPEISSLLGADDLPPLKPSDEVITPAVTFPTTLAPIIQQRLVPVFVDCVVGTYNVDPALVDQAIGPNTRALFLPHTLGNPFDVAAIMEIAKRRRLWLLEDGCDALGATFEGRLVGTFGAMSSLSFYPAHQMTMGEGGGVVVNHARLKKTARSIRDWGRDCWCDPGKSNTCGKRFGWQLGDLPFGYDHKYVYSNIGYNLKPTDLQAAIGVAQSDKIASFIEARRGNFRRLYDGLADLQEYLVLPQVDPRANPSPFGFPVTVREGIERTNLIRHLEAANIETRLVFGGNILRQPGFLNIERRVAGDLSQSDVIMRQTLFVGVAPAIIPEMVDYMIETFHSFFNR